LAYFEIRDWIKQLKPSNLKKNAIAEYSGVDRDTLLKMYSMMVLARRIELEEKYLLRRGYCRFFIGCGGKELIDIVFAQVLRPGDPFIGYYRNKAFDLYRGVSIRQKIYEAVGDARSDSTGGMLQPSHSSYPELGILPQASPTGSHALEAAGLGEAIKNGTRISGPVGIAGGRFKNNSIVLCSIGEGSTSSRNFTGRFFIQYMAKRATYSASTIAAGPSPPALTNNSQKGIRQRHSRVSSGSASKSKISMAPISSNRLPRLKRWPNMSLPVMARPSPI